MSRTVRVAIVTCLVALAAGRSFADDPAAQLSHQAMEECAAGRDATDRDVRERHFMQGEKLACDAIKLNDASAAAHFAKVCNMGELMRLDGETLTNALRLRTLLAELDRTLALEPDHIDAQSTKGQLLLRLPRLLGGDAPRGEAMLRHVIERDTHAFSSRLTLARHVESRGERKEAIALATRALQIARELGRADKIAQAQAALDELGAPR